MAITPCLCYGWTRLGYPGLDTLENDPGIRKWVLVVIPGSISSWVGKRKEKRKMWSWLLRWAAGTHFFRKLLEKSVQHSSVKITEGQRSWGVYPPTAICTWGWEIGAVTSSLPWGSISGVLRDCWGALIVSASVSQVCGWDEVSKDKGRRRC